MTTPFKLKSGNASAFKNLGSSPVKQDYHEALEHHKSYKAKKVQKYKKVFDKFQSQKQKAKQFVKKLGKFTGGKTLGVLGMMMGTTSKADQPIGKPRSFDTSPSTHTTIK